MKAARALLLAAAVSVSHAFSTRSRAALLPRSRAAPILTASSSPSFTSSTSFEQRALRVSDKITSQFATSVAAAALIGFSAPRFVKARVLSGRLFGVDAALSLAMFFAGSSLARSEVTESLARRPRALVGGVAAQFLIMPSLAFGLSRVFLSDAPLFAAGVVLVGCSPGGAASNVVALIAKANVALSVALTASSTLTAGLATPFLASKLMSTAVPVSPGQLYRPLLRTVLAPSILGVALNETLSNTGTVAATLRCVGAPFSTALIALIVGRVVADARLGCAAMLTAGGGTSLLGRLLLTLVLLHSGGFGLGLLTGRVLKLDVPSRRTLSIEVGMQNSALAVVLARALFRGTDNAAAVALPGAISALTHSILGGALASAWRANDSASEEEPAHVIEGYVPSGMTAEEYGAVKAKEAAQTAGKDLGAWGPRFNRTPPPAGSLFDKKWLKAVWFGGGGAGKKAPAGGGKR